MPAKKTSHWERTSHHSMKPHKSTKKVGNKTFHFSDRVGTKREATAIAKVYRKRMGEHTRIVYRKEKRVYDIYTHSRYSKSGKSGR